MTFEIPKINPLGGNNNISALGRSDKLQPKQTLLEQISGNDDDKKTEKKDKSDDTKKTDEKDEVSISKEARERLVNEINNPPQVEVKEISREELQALREKQDRLENVAIEFKGFNEIAKSRTLDQQETDRVKELRGEVIKLTGNENVKDDEIVAQADDVLAQAASEVPALLDKLNSGNITGNEFGKLDKINTKLNKANGFGISAEDNNSGDVSKIRKEFDNSLNEIGDRKLQREEVALLKQIQKELSTVEKFQVKVTDTIGPDGVLV